MIVCQNCKHRRTFHKKVDGNAKCSVPMCDCEHFVETDKRREIHKALDDFLDSQSK